MQEKRFRGFHTDAALRSLGEEIKLLAKHSSLNDQELSSAYHIGTHTIARV